MLIENEFGEISIDGGFLKESGVQISEMSAGCICCSLVGDFDKALKDVQAQFHPDRILIEPSGVGKLSDVIVAVQNTADETDDMKLNSFVTVADATKVKVYMKNFGEFYNNQIEAAGTIILSRTQKMSQEKLEAAVAMLREKNADAAILTTPWDQLDGKTILAAIEKVSLADELLEKMRAEHAADEAEHEHAHHHHDHEHAHEEHEHHHDHDHHDHEEHDHHHDHDEHAHHHDHDHECDDPNCSCHHHHHHADEVFTTWGAETPKQFTQADIDRILSRPWIPANTAPSCGPRALCPAAGGAVDCTLTMCPRSTRCAMVPPDYTGRLCVIGSQLKEDGLADPVRPVKEDSPHGHSCLSGGRLSGCRQDRFHQRHPGGRLRPPGSRPCCSAARRARRSTSKNALDNVTVITVEDEAGPEVLLPEGAGESSTTPSRC